MLGQGCRRGRRPGGPIRRRVAGRGCRRSLSALNLTRLESGTVTAAAGGHGALQKVRGEKDLSSAAASMTLSSHRETELSHDSESSSQ